MAGAKRPGIWLSQIPQIPRRSESFGEDIGEPNADSLGCCRLPAPLSFNRHRVDALNGWSRCHGHCVRELLIVLIIRAPLRVRQTPFFSVAEVAKTIDSEQIACNRGACKEAQILLRR